MAQDPTVTLEFRDGCPDCGERRVVLPPPLPVIPDDFDWRTRDYDSFRLFLMEELAHRFPDRRRWNAADMEVVIVELLAAAFDRMSHALDAIQGERYLETARQPASVRRLLTLIGYDPAREIDAAALNAIPVPDGEQNPTAWRVERYWQLKPLEMEAARLRGPQLVREQQRMVTLDDHEKRIASHPLVTRAQARLVWSGAWSTIMVSVLLMGELHLEDSLNDDPNANPPHKGIDATLRAAVLAYHRSHGLTEPNFAVAPTARRVLQILVEQFRMAGTEVVLADALEVPIFFWISVRARPGYFRSQLVDALTQAFDAESGGLFAPGNLGFGDAVYASDIVKAAAMVEGVETVCLNRFKRAGNHPDLAGAGVIPIDPDEIAVCFNDPDRPDGGSFRITVDGGLPG